MNEPGLLDHILAFMIGIIFPIQSLLQGLSQQSGDEEEEAEEPPVYTTKQKMQLYKANNISQWILTLILLGYWWFRDRSWGSLGIRMPEWDYLNWIFILSALFLGAYVYDVIIQVFSPKARRELQSNWTKRTPFLPSNSREFAGFFTVVITAAICEEILFRGFLINYLAVFFEATSTGWMWAIALPSAVFAVSHLYQGWEAVAKIGLLSLVFGSILVLSGSLLIPVILHFVVNLVGGWLSVKVLSKQE